MMPAIVVGIGQPLAGDDGVGPIVARMVAADGQAAVEAADASVLLPLLASGRRVVIVDAVIADRRPGTVLHLSAPALAGEVAPLSSHGLGLASTLEMARVLYGDAQVEIVGVVIARPGAGDGLSPEVAERSDRRVVRDSRRVQRADETAPSIFILFRTIPASRIRLAIFFLS